MTFNFTLESADQKKLAFDTKTTSIYNNLVVENPGHKNQKT